MDSAIPGLHPAPTRHAGLVAWVEQIAALTRPARVHWCDGSEPEKKALTDEACSKGILIKLDQKKWPGCYYHRSNPNDVARVEQCTFICTASEEEAGVRGDAEGRLAQPEEVVVHQSVPRPLACMRLYRVVRRRPSRRAAWARLPCVMNRAAWM